MVGTQIWDVSELKLAHIPNLELFMANLGEPGNIRRTAMSAILMIYVSLFFRIIFKIHSHIDFASL